MRTLAKTLGDGIYRLVQAPCGSPKVTPSDREYFGLTDEPFGKDISPGIFIYHLRFRVIGPVGLWCEKALFLPGDRGYWSRQINNYSSFARNLDENQHKLLYISDSNLKS